MRDVRDFDYRLDNMTHPKDTGDRATLAVMLALRSQGYDVLVPFGENTRYDLVVDTGARLLRVQCKSGSLRNGAVVFKVCSSYAHHPHPRVVRRNYENEVDCFAVYCRATSGVYLIPIGHLPKRSEASLRVEPARNGQRARIRRAQDFQIAEIVCSSAMATATAAALSDTLA